MGDRYRIIISSRNLYKEIELTPEMNCLTVGTSFACDVRLRKELFFAPIELQLQKEKEGWKLFGSDNIYFVNKSEVKKILKKTLVHGDELVVKYQNSEIDIFDIAFMIDFDYEKKEYELEIDINEKCPIKIGGTNDCHICIQDEYLGKDFLTLQNENEHLVIVDNNTQYGTFVNGVRISKRKAISDFDFFSIASFSFYYKQGKLYTSNKNNLIINGLNSRYTESYHTHFTYPKFNRNTRIQYVVPKEQLEIQKAAARPQKTKKNIIVSLIPSVIMLAMTIVLRGIMSDGGMFVIYSAVSMSVGIIMSIYAFYEENRTYKRECQERIVTYNNYIEEKKKYIEEVRKEELRVRNLVYESLENSIQEVENFGKRLFEKGQEDVDFLHIYLGRGRIESVNPVKYAEQEFVDLEDTLADIPKIVAESYRYIENAPVISDFYTACGIGIVGDKTTLVQMLKNITLDIAIRHFYYEVKLVYILEEDYISKMKWIRWLHNVENMIQDIRNIACNEESKNLILEELYIILSERDSALTERKETVFQEQYVVFITNSTFIHTHPISKYFTKAAKYGFTFVFLEEYEENLPQGCTEIIRMNDTKNGCVLKAVNGDVVSEFICPIITDEQAERVALKLGAIDVDEVSLEGELTKNITMFELLDILSVEDINLTERWANSMVYKSMAAPLGVKKKNQMVYLDISDKSGAHGPHGLVAGTTGSGKSEILQTYILSVATLFHPYEVGFVIIDFKGGGMANQFSALPHLIGTITNIDGREINRSLLSIKAEIVKRQEIFAKNKVNHINDYIKLYKAGKVCVPLPHLIMIVDEFAELKMEYPDFMKELISAARIGRTLGIHLILATQKPAGVVDSQIWSNSKFKLCLKVQTKEDSNEVIKTPLAAEILEPGRAYFQVGNNEIFDLFQSAYSGAAIPEGNETNDKVYAIYERNIWGKKILKYTNKKEKKEKDTISQLQAIVEYVNTYCNKEGIKKLPGICLPALKDKISINELSYEDKNANIISVPIGFFDDPEQQLQGEVKLELSKDNLYIVGSAQSGKTTLLQTIIYGLLRKYTPQQINIYIVDCGSMVLKIFEDSCHVGGVVLSTEEEKCKNLFKLLNGIITERKKVLSGKGIGNYAAYLDAGYSDMPMVVVMIDNMAAFKEYFSEQLEEMNRITREAQSVGISFIITAANANALNNKTQANFGQKLVLNCNDNNEYGNVLGHCKVTPKENAGRGLLVSEKRILEYQVAIFGESSKEIQRSEKLKEFISQRNCECTANAVKIPMVPEILSLEEYMEEQPLEFKNTGILPIGMDFNTVSLTSIQLRRMGSFSLVGDSENREIFVVNLMKMLSKTIIFHNIETIFIDEKNAKMKEFAKYGYVQDYTFDVAEGMELIDEYCDSVMERCEDGVADEDAFRMIIIHNMEVFRKVCADKKQSKKLSDAIKNAKEAKAFILITVLENQPIGFSASEVLKTLKEERQALVFVPLTANKVFDISGRVKPESSFDGTMAYRFSESTYSKIKLFHGEV